MKKIVIINGPNLNLVGKREPGIYGVEHFDTAFVKWQDKFAGTELIYFQSNIEGEIIDALQQYGFSATGIILNAGGYAHTSVAIGDAVAAINSPVVEVHISNVYAREPFRQHSFVAAKAKATIAGLGMAGYELAIAYLVTL